MKWELDWCTCGFDGGDWTERFDTEQEVRQAIAERDWNNSDATLRQVRMPDGTPWGRPGILGDWLIPEAA